jgi:hypothetical protein
MSVQSVINQRNLPTERIFESFFKEAGMALLKHIKFECRRVNTANIKDILLLDRVAKHACGGITDEVRVKLIRKSLVTIEEI